MVLAVWNGVAPDLRGVLRRSYSAWRGGELQYSPW